MPQPQAQQNKKPRKGDFKTTKEFEEYEKRRIEQQQDRRHNQW